MTEEEGRNRVVAEALTWEGTPYIPHGRIKGKDGGCDCLTFVAGVYENAGVIDRLPIPHYNRDWHLHDNVELYLFGKDDTPGMLHFCDEITGPPQPADIVLWKFGKRFSHAAIVIEWPRIIHAWVRRPVAPDDALRKTILTTVHEVIAERGKPRPRRYFQVKNWGT